MTTTSPPEYELLVSLLTKCPQTIEILPGDGSIWTLLAQNPDNTPPEPSLAPFLFVEGNLGIPQKILYKLYLHAVGVFKHARGCVPTWLATTTEQNYDTDSSSIRILADSSSVLLLANPAHQTALNTRKLLLRMHLIDPHAELCFTLSLLSSQHCAKHAELWYHRRWLLCAAYDANLSTTSGIDLFSHLRFTSEEALRQELRLVSRACELYPRNYFAWTHRLICMRSLLSDYLAGTDTVGFITIFRDEITEIRQWIERHVSDYSAIHTILALAQAAFQSRDSSLMGIIADENLLDHAVSLVKEYPFHEALWMYIRTALHFSESQQAQMVIENFVQPFVQLQCSRTDEKEEHVKALQHARQLLEMEL